MLRLAVFLSLVVCISAQCLFNTGVDASGNLLLGGANDPHWQVNSHPAVVVSTLNPAWISNTASAKWVSNALSGGAGPGTFAYTTTFTLGHHALALGYTIVGNIAADDTATISVNGVPKFTTPDPPGTVAPWNTLNSFSISSAGGDFVFGPNTLTVTVTNGGAGATGFLLELTSLCAVGDPSFVDLEGKRFIFKGEVGKVFHVFSDPFFSINALFASANEATGKGTVISALGVRWENRSLIFSTRSAVESSFALDGVPRALTRGHGSLLADSCLQLTWAEMTLRLQTPRHILDFELLTAHDNHINTTYFNLDFSLTHPEPALCGGIMGQSGKPSTENAKFITEDLLSTSAITNKYSAHRVC